MQYTKHCLFTLVVMPILFLDILLHHNNLLNNAQSDNRSIDDINPLYITVAYVSEVNKSNSIKYLG